MLYLLTVTLRFTKEAVFPFVHGRVLYAALRRALDLPPASDFPEDMLPMAPESGRCHYREGAPYALGLVWLGESCDPWPLVEGLRCLGRDRGLAGRHSLGGNYEVIGVTDGFAEAPLEDGTLPEPLSLSRLASAARELGRRESVRLRFVSPLRLSRHGHTKVKGHAFCDADRFEADRLLENLTNRVARLAPGLAGSERMRGEDLADTRAEVRHLIWLDLPKHDVPQTTGGAVGEVELFFPGRVDAAARPLLLGQFLGAGKDISFGFGRYRILPEIDGFSPPRRAEPLGAAAAARPDRTVLQPLREFDDLEDDDDWAAENWAEDELTDDDLRSLALGNRRPSPLAGRVILNAAGKPRALAIPSSLDQVLQRRVNDLLTPAVDELLETSSYAYRRGLSRRGAATALRRAYDQGRRWILRADVAAFFDSVDWSLLRLKLEALWDDDPLVDQILRWIDAPVRFGDQLIRRDRGLPQGAVISPLLANLFLDQFDEAVREAGFLLVRYADDFVVCCRDREEAEEALRTVRRALDELDLKVNEGKVRLTTFDQGFSYLGYAFCRSLAVPAEAKKRPSQWLSDLEDAGPDFWAEAVANAPQGAWLAGLDPESSRPLTSPAARAPKPRAGRAEFGGRRPVHITDPDLKIRTSRGRLLLGGEDGAAPAEIPLSLVEALVCHGHVYLGSPVLRACLKHNTPVYFCTRAGRPIGQTTATEDSAAASTVTAQVDFVRDEARCLTAAREMVSAKISNSRLVLQRQRGRDERDEFAIKALKDILADVQDCDSAASLRGLEGRAAVAYFEGLRAHIPPAYEFETRTGPSAMDPVNALLNFGYSLLYRQMTAFLHVERLHPGLGVLHRPSDRYNPLGSDLMEEFRHLIELMVLRLMHYGQIAPEDFRWHEKMSYCRIEAPARQAFIRIWEKRLGDESRPDPGGPKLTFREIMHGQVKKLKTLILDPEHETYTAYRGR